MKTNEPTKSFYAVATLLLAGILPFVSSAQGLSTQFDPAAPLTPEMAVQLSQNVNRPVIVVMKNQLSGPDAESDQAPLMGELRQVNASRIKPYRLVNAFAATVSDGELARLKANPAVAQVIPDVVIHRKPEKTPAQGYKNTLDSPSPLSPNVIPGACAPDGQVLLEPEALETINANSDVPNAKTARSLGFTGSGVKVAFIADGVDPKNVNFIRPDGKSAFIDYKDFSGDGPNAQTAGREGFLDSNAIAGQGIEVYDVNGFSAQSYPSACNIRIEGVAPGASLVGLKVYSWNNWSTTSMILEAIEYAVSVDHVDVLNESTGSNYIPDVTSLDIFKQFDEAAAKAGVTVTVSSGDAGPTNTISTPASEPAVIDVGASTTFRFYAQTNWNNGRYFATNGWLNDNISPFSSSGFDETGGTVDLVAPGDRDWTACDANSTYEECYNYQYQPSTIAESGGTSLSAPLTAGTAALVIEAYRHTHHGASPSPALVKQIVVSTATDLGAPASEQGAGLLNAYKAVLLAESIGTSHGSPARVGESLLLSETQLNAVGAAGEKHTWPVTVTNTGAQTQTVKVTGRTFGTSRNIQTGSVTLSDSSSPQFTDGSGNLDNYATFTFNVPGNANRLAASIAYQGAYPDLILIDPQGRLAAASDPAGIANLNAVDVRDPAPGTWTGVVTSVVAASGGLNGTVLWQVSTQQFAPFGSVTPSSFSLAPGKSQTIQVTASNPSAPGDLAGSIVLTPSGGGVDPYVGQESNSIPVTLRSLVDLANGGEFSGLLTGGNGRPEEWGQFAYYEFNVGAGHKSITANLSLTNDGGDYVGAYLVNPNGNAVGFGQNTLGGTSGLSLSAFVLNPLPGTWTLIVDLAEPVVGDEISQAFAGNIKLDEVSATATGLPNSTKTKLPAGVPVTIPVSITNNGAAPELFFIDARLNLKTTVTLQLDYGYVASNYEFPLPLTNGQLPQWTVPTETSSLQVSASANVPVEFDYSPQPGDPDLFAPPSHSKGTYTANGTYTPSSGTVSQGQWFAWPTEIGPFPKGAPAGGQTTMSMQATTKAFDTAVTSATGDRWLGSIDAEAFNNFTPVTINPGQTATIDVTITPSGPSGTVVQGYLYVDDFVYNLPPTGEVTGDELAAIPYSYTIQ